MVGCSEEVELFEQGDLLGAEPPLSRAMALVADPVVPGAFGRLGPGRWPTQAELMAIHPFGATRSEQCIGLIDWSFTNSAFLSASRIPSHYEWFLGADHRPAYEHHRGMLQPLQWNMPGEWVLKWPKHIVSLGALLATYPDARVV